jgi:hypothetical protein
MAPSRPPVRTRTRADLRRPARYRIGATRSASGAPPLSRRAYYAATAASAALALAIGVPAAAWIAARDVAPWMRETLLVALAAVLAVPVVGYRAYRRGRVASPGPRGEPRTVPAAHRVPMMVGRGAVWFVGIVLGYVLLDALAGLLP